MCKEVEGDRKHANPTIIIEYKWIPEKRQLLVKRSYLEPFLQVEISI